MTFLPIVDRELRVASRRRATYWIRTGAAAAILVVGTWFFLMMRREPATQISMVLFGITSGAAVLYCLLAGMRATADCISQEKRDGTLGLLFLTDLKGYDVVLGKMAANSINTFYGVLAVVPMMAIPLLMGGVTFGEFGRMAALALNTLFFSLSLGIFVSAMSLSARNAVGMTFLLLFVLAGMGPAIAGWLLEVKKFTAVATALFLPSPGFTFAMAFDSTFRTRSQGYYLSMAVIHIIAWAGLIFASLVAPRTWQDRPAVGSKMRLRDRVQSWIYGDGQQRRELRGRLLDENAFFWLASRSRFKHVLPWIIIGALAILWFAGWAKWRREWLNEGIFVTTGVVLNLLLKGWFASESGRRIAEDRQNGALELLLSTPITVREILHGQWLALRRQFLGPIIFVVALWLTFMASGPGEYMSRSERGAWVAFWLSATVMLVLDLWALYWVGMWQGLTARSPQQAASTTSARILVLPWVMFFLAVLVVGLSGTGGIDWEFFLACWFLAGLFIDFTFAAIAREKLLSEFRLVAEQRFAAKPGFWQTILGIGGSSGRGES